MQKNKYICLIIALLLVINNPLIAYAESAPGTISVDGGTIGAGGVEGNSGVLKGTAIAVIMATLASAGITVKLAADDYARGNTALNYISNKFAEWENNADAGWEAYQALDSTKIGANGELYLPEAAQSVMQKFLNWLTANDDINYQDSSTGGAFGGAYYGFGWSDGLKTFSFEDGIAGYIVAIKQSATSDRYLICSFREGTRYKWKNNNVSAYSSDITLNGVLYNACANTSLYSTSHVGLIDLSTYGYYGRNGFYQWLNGGDYNTPDTNIENTGFYTENTDIPSLIDETGTGKILVVQPGLIPQVQDSYVGSNNTSINIKDYLDALTDLYGQKAIPQDITDLPDIAIQGVDALTGTKEQVGVIDRDIALDQEIIVPADDASITWPEVPSGSTSISDDTSPEPDVSIPAMSFDLTKYFPFCLPFDIYDIFAKLNADPVTPEITIDWGNILGSLGVDYVMHLDLHDFDEIAELLRNMETAAFVVGLAVVTRQMFIRG